jgi:hypothetical protein
MKQRIFVTALLLLAGCGRAPPAGPVMVYQIDPATKPAGMADDELTEEMVAVIDRRLNASRPNRAKVAALENGTIEVRVYRGLPQTVAEIRRQLRRQGTTLEFRIAAHRRHAEMRRWIEDTQPGGAYPFPAKVLRDGQVVARWMPVNRAEAEKMRVRERTLAALSRPRGIAADELNDAMSLDELAEDDADREAIWKALEAGFGDRSLPLHVPSADRERLNTVGDVIHYVGAAVTIGLHGEIAWNISRERGVMLLLVEPLGKDEPRDRRGLRFQAVSGEHLGRATLQSDADGSPAVGFVLDSRGALLFRRLTLAYRPEADGSQSRLAILLDGEIHSAPNLREPIAEGAGQISGDFTVQEAGDLADALNAGVLPAGLKLISERTATESTE